MTQTMTQTPVLELTREAFAAEAGVYMTYRLRAARAREAGDYGLAALFEEVAENEWAHGELWFNRMFGEQTAQEALRLAANGEHREWSEMYAQWADQARDAGDTQGEFLFRAVASVEARHEGAFRAALQARETGGAFQASEAVCWRCEHCGYQVEDDQAPAACPVCARPRSSFQRIQF